jgi:hypothetical protein
MGLVAGGLDCMDWAFDQLGLNYFIWYSDHPKKSQPEHVP